jgi:xanthosine utilization system XapX-like protein
VYAALDVRSPAPPVVALVGLLGILVGEQARPLVQRLRARPSSVTSSVLLAGAPVTARRAARRARAAPAGGDGQRQRSSARARTDGPIPFPTTRPDDHVPAAGERVRIDARGRPRRARRAHRHARPTRPHATALAVANGRVLAVGSEAEVLAYRPAATRVVDAGGRTLVPGLNDSHTHLIRGGLSWNLELRWDGVPSLADALELLRRQAERTPAPQWVRVVGGWSEFQFVERRMPTSRS